MDLQSRCMATGRFDRDYYQRFYRDPKTRVYEPADVERMARFVLAWCERLDLPLRAVADLGCGLGYWRDALRTLAPRARYRGVEISDYLCDTMGWEKGSVVDWRGRGTYDLVICHGVLQYLSTAEAALAIDNLASLCRGVLFLEALTKADWEENCDRSLTDGKVHLRTGAWYRRRLAPHFVGLGGGVWLKRETGIAVFELERTDG
ncbi:MAG: class I SAM-dependent methyltransferase [Planctomycetota bacterium]